MNVVKLSEDQIDSLAVFLWDDLNNLASGWHIKRSCESHNTITMALFMVMFCDIPVEELVLVEKKGVRKVSDHFRYQDDRGSFYNWLHDQSRDVCDHADKYAGKHPSLFVKAIIKHWLKVYDKF